MTNRHISGFIIVLLTSSCSFLDIDTPGIVNNGKMFGNEQGFIDAMDGVYASMAAEGLYGKELSFGFIDEIAQLYFNDYGEGETTLTKSIDLKYRDEDVRERIDEIWGDAYNVISSANSIIDNVSGHSYPGLPHIEGEARAVRAMVHFDILRLFAPGMEKAESEAIPYVDHFSITPFRRLAVKDVYDRITDDLERSYKLLSESPEISGRTPSNVYMNKYAVAALLARVHNWAGNHGEAAKYAEAALEGDFQFTRDEQVKSLFKGYLANRECIFGLHAPNMYLDVRSNLYPTRLTESMLMVRDNYQTLFEVSTFTSTNNDYRYQACFSKRTWTKSVTLCVKLYDKNYDEDQIVPTGRIPGPNLIRIPEMYYILAESAYASADTGHALEYLNTVVTARGLRPLSLEDIDTEAKFRRKLVGEYIKEYWGEGQIFFIYKRFNMDMDGVNSKHFTASDEVYVLPLPESEYENGEERK